MVKYLKRLKTKTRYNNYFKLDNLMSKIAFRKNDPDLLLYQATLDNVFNRPGESNRLIKILLQKHAQHFNDTIIKELYLMRSSNAFRLQDYKSAFLADSIIVNNYRQVCDSSEIETRKDDITIYRVIAKVPKMEIKRSSESKVPLKRDIAGLYNVTIVVKNDSSDFVFDTGANISVISESEAKKYEVRFLGGKSRTGTGTSIRVEGQMGLLDLKLGNMEIKNAIFLVLSDSLLTFANGDYTIKGIIGFPIMYAFQEFIMHDDKYLIVPMKPEETSNRNLALEGLYPIIMVTFKNDTLPFHFDSGASNTDLTSLFFNKYKDDIVGKCKKAKVTIGSAGGMEEHEAYVLDSLNLFAGDSHYKLDSLKVFTKDLMGSDIKYQYGNFGQDYINKFSDMKINFVFMNISFSNKKKQ